MVTHSLHRLFSVHAASVLERQLRLGTLIGDQHQWTFDMASGRLQFNEQHSFPVQLLGSESEESNTWLWAWANAA